MTGDHLWVKGGKTYRVVDCVIALSALSSAQERGNVSVWAYVA